MSPNEMLVADSAGAEELPKLRAPQASPRAYQIVWFNVLTFSYWHVAALHALLLCCCGAVKWQTILFSWAMYVLGVLGITAGAHRLWAHRTYRATLPLQLLLMLLNSISFQNTATDWVRDHRLHHKYSDTDADPHNATRGFFYSHMGWLLVRKHPEVRRRGATIDMSDIYANPVLRFQKKYAVPWIGAVCFVLPALLPVWAWDEAPLASWHMVFLRYVCNLHAIFLVNSAAHLWGGRPYDARLPAAQNLPSSLASLGEAWHNYHHAFPWDYKASELGNTYLNPTTMFIDFFAYIGWAYDLKTVSQDMIEARKTRTGDGTNLWGWEDVVKRS